jgi:hypothetical protein
MDAIFNQEMPQARVAVLLEHFSQIDDDREPWRVVYPLAEVLLLLTCATIASCDDFEDIVAWGEQHLDFLRRFSESHFGIPCVRWLQSLSCRAALHPHQDDRQDRFAHRIPGSIHYFRHPSLHLVGSSRPARQRSSCSLERGEHALVARR